RCPLPAQPPGKCACASKNLLHMGANLLPACTSRPCRGNTPPPYAAGGGGRAAPSVDAGAGVSCPHAPLASHSPAPAAAQPDPALDAPARAPVDQRFHPAGVCL